MAQVNRPSPNLPSSLAVTSGRTGDDVGVVGGIAESRVIGIAGVASVDEQDAPALRALEQLLAGYNRLRLGGPPAICRSGRYPPLPLPGQPSDSSQKPL